MQKKRKTKKDSPHGGSKKNRGVMDPDDVEVIPLNSRFSPLGSPAQETHFFGASDLSTPAGLALASAPRIEQWNAKSRTYLTGTALSGKSGPPVGSYDIGESDDAYLFRVSLPGVKREAGLFSCEIEKSGMVHVMGETKTGGAKIKRKVRSGNQLVQHKRVFDMITSNLCPPGPFKVSFRLPGPVDPRMFTGNFGSNGIFEAIVMKYRGS